MFSGVFLTSTVYLCVLGGGVFGGLLNKKIVDESSSGFKDTRSFQLILISIFQ